MGARPLIAAGLLVLSACGASASVSLGAGGFYIAPVLASRPAGSCDGREIANVAGDRCYLLGDAVVDRSGVASAEPGSREPATTWDVTVTFTPEGLASFAALASECVVKAARCPEREAAIVVDRRVVLAPALMTAEFESPDIVITGPIPVGFDRAAATELAAKLSGTPS